MCLIRAARTVFLDLGRTSSVNMIRSYIEFCFVCLVLLHHMPFSLHDMSSSGKEFVINSTKHTLFY